MSKEREPLLMVATGKKGVGKTYTTIKDAIDKYIKPTSKGRKARKVLIYDINSEYTSYKAISVSDIRKFSHQSKIEVRRVLPIMKNGKPANLEEMVEILNKIINTFTGGLLVLEDINRYMIGAKSVEIIGLLATNRHRDLDIIVHFQSLSALDPRMWQNTGMVRFHKQSDKIDRYKQRIPNFEMFKLAQLLVNYKYLKQNNKRFYCWVSLDDDFIAGNFTIHDFRVACDIYNETANRTTLNRLSKEFGGGNQGRYKALRKLSQEFEQTYFQGIKKK